MIILPSPEQWKHRSARLITKQKRQYSAMESRGKVRLLWGFFPSLLIPAEEENRRRNSKNFRYFQKNPICTALKMGGKLFSEVKHIAGSFPVC